MRTKYQTIAAWLCELIETHMLTCNEAFPHPEDCPARVISEVHGTRAMIDEIASRDIENGTEIRLSFDDGSIFRICVEDQ